MENNQLPIEDFRRIIRLEFGEKGIYPPEPGSKVERQLYEQWLEGKKKLRDSRQASQ